jgi:hypothetical protein
MKVVRKRDIPGKKLPVFKIMANAVFVKLPQAMLLR